MLYLWNRWRIQKHYNFLYTIRTSKQRKILCIVEDNNIETVLSYLKEDAKDIDHFLTTGQLSILSVADLYLEGGNFDPDRMIKKLQRKQ